MRRSVDVSRVAGIQAVSDNDSASCHGPRMLAWMLPTIITAQTEVDGGAFLQFACFFLDSEDLAACPPSRVQLQHDTFVCRTPLSPTLPPRGLTSTKASTKLCSSRASVGQALRQRPPSAQNAEVTADPSGLAETSGLRRSHVRRRPYILRGISACSSTPHSSCEKHATRKMPEPDPVVPHCGVTAMEVWRWLIPP